MAEAARRSRIRALDPGALPILGLTLLLGGVLALSRDSFFTYSNLYSILYGVSIEGFAVIGFTYLMIMGEVDLSVGAVYAFSGTFAGFLMLEGLPLWLALPATLVVCAGIGLLNGVLTVRLRLNSLMLTIGTMILVRGLVDILTPVLVGSTFSRSYRALARLRCGGINVTIVVMVLMVLILNLLLRRGASFKQLYYVGQSAGSAQLYGIRAGGIKIMSFVAASVTAAIGGILAASRIMHADVTTGQGLEFKVVTAAVLGGASLFGGRGTILGSVLGLVFLATVLDGMVKFEIEPLLQQLVVGVILIAAVAADTFMSRNRQG